MFSHYSIGLIDTFSYLLLTQVCVHFQHECMSARGQQSQSHSLLMCLCVGVCVTEQVCVYHQRFMSCNILRAAERDKSLQNGISDTVITNLENYTKHQLGKLD